jgi:hypothetical protein
MIRRVIGITLILGIVLFTIYSLDEYSYMRDTWERVSDTGLKQKDVNFRLTGFFNLWTTVVSLTFAIGLLTTAEARKYEKLIKWIFILTIGVFTILELPIYSCGHSDYRYSFWKSNQSHLH